MKNSKELINNWQEIRKNLKEKFVKLTENDLLFAENQKNEMINRLQQKYGLSREEIQKIISNL
ncbi:MAG: general stress protein CsbD [Lutibacter sp. BRH_c52]|nr:MAG: general stress protein CsbD [Lutibacter sp. BRH_c52]HCE53497.1 general stress protein CsbD [Lutibacter sp.]